MRYVDIDADDDDADDDDDDDSGSTILPLWSSLLVMWRMPE